MWIVRVILIVALFIALLGFSIQNVEEKVEVVLANTKYVNVPLIYVVYWACIAGLLISIILFVAIYLRQVTELRRQKRTIDSLNNEIIALRNRSIEEADDGFLVSKKEDKK